MFFFFSPRGEGIPCGMFTLPHLLVLLLCIISIIIGVKYTLKIKNENIYKIIKAIAIVVVILEIIKIYYNFHYGYTYLDAWFPLAFCSLFIYSIIMVGFFKGKIREMGMSFLVGGGILAGIAFLIFPTTSLMMHPIYHYLSIHSMLFHSLMAYLGIVCYLKKMFVFNKKGYLSYIIFCLIFMICALIINKIYDCNMMFLKEPFNLPIPLLQTINRELPFLYKIIIMLLYLVIPYGIMYLVDKIRNNEVKKNVNL